MAELETEIRHAFERHLGAMPARPDLRARIRAAVEVRSSRPQAWRVVAASTALLLVGAVIFYVLQARHNQPAPIVLPTPILQSPTPTSSATASASSTPQASPSSSPSATASPGVISDCPARVSNISGAYSFSCPAGWRYVNCERSPFINPFTWLVNPQGCSQSPHEPRMIVESVPGDHANDPASQGIYVGQLQSSRAVTVAGVGGTRRTYLVTADNLISPPKGTVQVLYTFVTGGLTYFADYDRYPGDPDLTAKFDQMVTASLRFSASG